MTQHVFTYGTLIFPDIMEAVTGHQFEACAGTLHGYSRYALRHVDYPGIVPSSQGSTEGVLYFHVNDAALHRLDAFEDQFYARERLRIETNEGEHSALVYTLTPSAAQRLLTTEPWCPQTFAKHHRQEYVDACQRERASQSSSSG